MYKSVYVYLVVVNVYDVTIRDSVNNIVAIDMNGLAYNKLIVLDMNVFGLVMMVDDVFVLFLIILFGVSRND